MRRTLNIGDVVANLIPEVIVPKETESFGCETNLASAYRIDRVYKLSPAMRKRDEGASNNKAYSQARDRR
jgi:hypothetical protein